MKVSNKPRARDDLMGDVKMKAVPTFLKKGRVRFHELVCLASGASLSQKIINQSGAELQALIEH